MPPEPRRLFIFRIFAARAAAELERLRVESRLVESERRYRDLYEEAPNAYMSLGVDLDLISVNRRATHLLGYSAKELLGSSIMTHFADTPAGRGRAAQAFADGFGGHDASGLELEMRRRDGSPLWVNLWMRPMRGIDGAIQAVHSIWIDVTDRVLAEAERARLTEQNLYLRQEIKSVHNFEEIVGRSAALADVLAKVRRVAPTDATVLISGETGTGKELIARAIHSTSPRSDKPLIKVNCAALPAGLVESELFGHEKGAFTGAIARHSGRFELADGGTIFLDEIGELPAESQAKLLRVLQEHEFDRVGGTSSRKVDVRVIAATNRDLLKAVREKAFREDLYYRLSVFPLPLPPLRDRAEDIPLLAKFLLDKFAARVGRRFDGIEPGTLRRLMAYPWPGNVRELENVLERAVILATGPALEVDHDVLSQPGLPPVGATSAALEDVERAHILAVLQQTRWVIDGRGRGGHPRHPPQYPPQPAEEARPLALVPRTLVAPTTGRGPASLRVVAALRRIDPAWNLHLPAHERLEATARASRWATAPGSQLSLRDLSGACHADDHSIRGGRFGPHPQARGRSPRPLGRRAGVSLSHVQGLPGPRPARPPRPDLRRRGGGPVS